MYIDVLPAYMLYISSVKCPQRPEKGIGSLELELQMVVSLQVDAGNQTRASGRTVPAP